MPNLAWKLALVGCGSARYGEHRGPVAAQVLTLTRAKLVRFSSMSHPLE